jgi:hypothetical protein
MYVDLALVAFISRRQAQRRQAAHKRFEPKAHPRAMPESERPVLRSAGHRIHAKAQNGHRFSKKKKTRPTSFGLLLLINCHQGRNTYSDFASMHLPTLLLFDSKLLRK